MIYLRKSVNEIIKNRYNRVSRIYDMMDRMIKEQWRQDLLSAVSGDVIEVGVGTGGNLVYYPNSINSLTGIDFSQGMLKFAKEKSLKMKFHFPVELVEGDIQDLPFPDNTFDAIVATCVFCSVPDPVKGLQELKRVCKPDGRIYMIEHMKSDNKWAGLVMDLLNPLTVRLWGANINRETIKNIKLASLNIETNESLMGSIVRKLVLTAK
ncbi:class I SAM-dependent methyltransferase [Neobacillus citreus]|uniref:class I SAM-dependent methyltransferase n=1 Tax=Neobacillus citreus TaxID=2833578 RepID=UPI003B84771D